MEPHLQVLFLNILSELKFKNQIPFTILFGCIVVDSQFILTALNIRPLEL